MQRAAFLSATEEVQMKSTVYCYDRYATYKRFGAAALVLMAAGVALTISTPTQAAVTIERLPTVVITGKSVKPVQLPTVVVEGRRQSSMVVAAAQQQAPEMKRVAYVQPARY
jgi:hypothetical protein